MPLRIFPKNDTKIKIHEKETNVKPKVFAPDLSPQGVQTLQSDNSSLWK
jgi:hypothetical protein